jgi:hypothetical protein
MSIGWERPKGFSVRLFLPGGDPEGVKIIEKSNWTGTGLVIPRTLFGESRSRAEFQRAGVYLLVGPDETSQLPRAYLGEGDPSGPRLDQHVGLEGSNLLLTAGCNQTSVDKVLKPLSYH